MNGRIVVRIVLALLVVVESVSSWGQVSPMNTGDPDAGVCKTSRFDVIERI